MMNRNTVNAHAEAWGKAVASRHGLIIFAPRELTIYNGPLSEANVPFSVGDNVTDEDAPVLVDRVLDEIRTVVPSGYDENGLRTLAVGARAHVVGGRPGLIAHLDIQPI